MDPAESKHLVLGLIFLKYLSDVFQGTHARLVSGGTDGTDAEDPEAYRARGVFWLPVEVRWPRLSGQSSQSGIGGLLDDAMATIERVNPALKGVLPKDYARPELDKRRLGQLIDLIGTTSMGSEDARSSDVPGQVFGYLLSLFALDEGKGGGSFYTPSCVVTLLVEMLRPLKGRVYDPCCGSSGMLAESVELIRARSGGAPTSEPDNSKRVGISKAASRHVSERMVRDATLTVFGQESDYETWRLAKMNLAVRGIHGQIAHGDSFRGDCHPDLKADYILASPPFNQSGWAEGRRRQDSRWRYGVPPARNANFAWLQHIVDHLAPTGSAGVVLANSSMSSVGSVERGIRKNLIEDDLVDCVVALPGQLFYSTAVPACVWFLARNRRHGTGRDRSHEILFIDARKRGHMMDRTNRELSDQDISRLAGIYHAWRGEPGAGDYEDVLGSWKSATLEQVRDHGHVLTPRCYVGTEPQTADVESFERKFSRLVGRWQEQQGRGQRLDARIAASLAALGFENRKQSS